MTRPYICLFSSLILVTVALHRSRGEGGGQGGKYGYSVAPYADGQGAKFSTAFLGPSAQ
ncbi:hypothetical protein [Streptomyces sp. NBC_01578]|uniref:hypothetical protein n=1 Tax=Streptomyces sp. NBC_01578 TaxID=2975884 RepID=UPI00386F9335